MRLATLVFALALLSAGAVRADMSWDLKTETTVKVGAEHRQLPLSSANFAVKNNVLRLDTGAEQPTMFINTANDAVIFVNYRAEIFMLTDFNQVAAYQASEREAMRTKLPIMEAGIAQAPPEQRTEQQALIEGQKRKYELWSRPYTVRPTGERAVIMDHPCLKYEGLSGGEVFQEIWVAEDIVPDPSYQSQHASRLANLDPQQYQHLARVRGLPIKVVSSYGPVTVTTTLTRYTTAAITADAFIIPDNFRETEAASKRNQ